MEQNLLFPLLRKQAGAPQTEVTKIRRPKETN